MERWLIFIAIAAGALLSLWFMIVDPKIGLPPISAPQPTEPSEDIAAPPLAAPSPSGLALNVEIDFGDAPEYDEENPETMTVYGKDDLQPGFPTIINSEDDLWYVSHEDPSAEIFLGRDLSVELEPQTVDRDIDDGLISRDLAPCFTQKFEVTVTIPEIYTPDTPLYFNALFDWDQDGEWDGDNSACGFKVEEWAVQDLRLDESPYFLSVPGTYTVQIPVTTAQIANVWTRLTVTTKPVPRLSTTNEWHGQGQFDFGESEDWIFRVSSVPCVPITDLPLPSNAVPCASSATPEEEADNGPPDAVDDSASTNQGDPVTIPVLDNDSDPDDDPLTITDPTDPPNGSVSCSGSSCEYTPDPGFCGTDSFDYSIDDGNGGTDTATVTVEVACVNSDPDAVDDSETTDEDTPVTIDVLNNDTDPENDPLTITGNTSPSNGSVTCSASECEYTPNADYNGTDSFEYTISDGNGGTDTATVTITIDPVNDPPDAVDDSATTDEDTPVTIDVLNNDTDPENDPLTITGNTSPSNGSVTCSASECEYTPNLDYCGSDSFDYTISDGNGGTDTATVTVTVDCVNDPPDAVDDSETTDEDTPVTIDVLNNDTDPENDPLTITGNTSPSNGSVTCSASDCEYTPNAGFNGTDTFDYTISDGNGGTDTATVTITINPVNDPPDAVDDSATTDEDTPVTIDVLNNDSDPENDPLTITGNTSPANGSVTCSASECEYTPNSDYCGSDSFDYTISDGNGGTDTATVTVTVDCVNDPPDAVDDSETTDEDTPVTIQVLTNDSDPENDPLTITSNTNPSNGSVSCTASNCEYTPSSGFSGTDTFDYTISDGNGGTDTATVTITINPVNDPPDAVDDSESTNEDTPVTIQVLTNDSDPENDPLTITGNTNPTNGSVNCTGSNCEYTPNTDYCGSDSFDYTISDGNGGTDTATVTIDVACVNDPPDAVDDSANTNEDTPVTIQVLTNDSDPENDPLTITGNTNPSNGSVNCSGSSCEYTPNANYCGTDSFDYTISDGNGGSDTATVTVNVACVNDPPDAVDDSETTQEDTPVTIQVLTNDSDPENDPLTITGNTNPSNGTVSCSTSNCTYTPNSGYFGTDTFQYTISDGNGGTDTATVTITITEDPSGWDKSSLLFDGQPTSSSCTGSGTGTVSATVKNGGEDMEGVTTWELWYAPSGNAKNGTMISSGVIPALTKNGTFAITAAGITQDGNFKFKAKQREGHPGTGELWSDTISFDASSCS